ncbi:hypothetical protein PtrSN002B_003555 [Pyrenophora tritici-repentis]|uniref:Uncharacterized protein n=2 Tax=Pyrenophora tritici-repentis TaxID=45151 RepID=A0A5M9LGI8_9PLEO|nr:uncharacterized protein PTRG_10101 [Pyrenophora tritici-repentis Pt-1C-BFP]KAA8621479.1 hypothetical protein PtrV1_05980 [Pyrenophora tritici-repentis]EDU43152.1 predicted protein [Pyrenophora tritici-repentis Pt-1C-BFP]KAF7450719.1 hypothetical protein A1F99_053350 [Pyrenophora tritici-repentis]KAF7573360.1 hypothetical protein PtrM4_082650 [Pyrenophora tritici-repentis]KAI0571770.1 hypothetical protein Alg130_10756 [Pyrenophora tritici-repentis]
MKATFYFAAVAFFAPSVLGHCIVTGNNSACKITYACDNGTLPPRICDLIENGGTTYCCN